MLRKGAVDHDSATAAGRMHLQLYTGKGNEDEVCKDRGEESGCGKTGKSGKIRKSGKTSESGKTGENEKACGREEGIKK